MDDQAEFNNMLFDVIDEVLKGTLGVDACEAFLNCSGLDLQTITPDILHQKMLLFFESGGAEIIERIILTRLFDRLELPFGNHRPFEIIVEEARGKFRKRTPK